MKSFSELVRELDKKWGHTYIPYEEAPYGEETLVAMELPPLSYKAGGEEEDE